MKLVAINGSHTGKRGYTHFLIEKLFEGAKKEGAEEKDGVHLSPRHFITWQAYAIQ
jgi:hypothetical protein